MLESLQTILRSVASALQIPVIIILVILIAAAIVLTGSIIVEGIVERRHLKVNLPKLIDDIKAEDTDLAPVISSSGLLNRQKTALLELIAHPDIDNTMREALAERLLEEENTRYANIVKISEMVAKLGPMFGLLGTLIPLGPGIIALGQGDTFTLSASLLTAFDTTIAGLAAAAVATVISTIRKGWYNNYMSLLETIMECIVEKCSDNHKELSGK